MDRKLHWHQEPQVLPRVPLLGRALWPVLLFIFPSHLLRQLAVQGGALDQFLGPRHLPGLVLLSREANSAQLQQPRGALFEILEPLRCFSKGLPEHLAVVP